MEVNYCTAEKSSRCDLGLPPSWKRYLQSLMTFTVEENRERKSNLEDASYLFVSRQNSLKGWGQEFPVPLYEDIVSDCESGEGFTGSSKFCGRFEVLG